jgi:hypothetical protein
MMKNNHGYDHMAAIKAAGKAEAHGDHSTSENLGFHDGYNGAECSSEGSATYRAAWEYGKKYREWNG